MNTKALPNMDQDIRKKPILPQKPLDQKTREILNFVREQNDLISCKGVLERPHPYNLTAMERKFDPLPSIGGKEVDCSVDELDRLSSRTWSVCSENVLNSNRSSVHPPVRRTKSCSGMEMNLSKKKPHRGGQLPPLQYQHGTLPERPTCPEPSSPNKLEDSTINY